MDNVTLSLIPYFNFAALLVSSFLLTFFYLKSVGPAALERKIGPTAYQKCATWRALSAVFMIIVGINYVVYYWRPFSYCFLSSTCRSGTAFVSSRSAICLFAMARRTMSIRR